MPNRKISQPIDDQFWPEIKNVKQVDHRVIKYRELTSVPKKRQFATRTFVINIITSLILAEVCLRDTSPEDSAFSLLSGGCLPSPAHDGGEV